MKKLNVLTRMLLLVALLVGSMSVRGADTYVKVTDASGLVAGNKYIIVYENGNNSEAAGAQEGNGTNNYRSAVGVAVSSSTVTITNQAVTVFTLGGSVGAYTLLGSDGNYLCKNSNATKSNNYLQSSSTDTDDKTKWEITYSNSVVTIKNNFATSFTIRYNSSNPRFSCYTNNGQNAVALYRYMPTVTYSIDPSASGSVTVENSGNIVPSGSSIASGTVLDIVATPEAGMQFKNWTVTGTGSSVASPNSATTTLTIGTENTTLTANFENALSYEITAVANNDAYGEVAVAGATITAIPNTGYKVPSTEGYAVTTGTATVVNNGDGTFTVSPSTDCTVRIDFIEKATPTFSFASATASAIYGGTVTPPALTNDESTGSVTYVSSNTKVATVDENTGEVTTVSVGTTNITAIVAEDADYKTAQAFYTLTVNENATASGAKNKEIILEEGFSSFSSQGGRDSQYNQGSGTFSAASCDYTSWKMSGSLYAANSCVRMGTGSANGSLTTGNLNVAGSATLTFDLAGWGTDSGYNFDVSGTNCTLTGNNSLTKSSTPAIASSSWNSYTVNISVENDESPITLTFTGKRLFFDSVKLEKILNSYTVDVTVPASGWGTFCSPYALDLGNAATTVEAYAVSKYNAAAGTVTFEKITGKVPAKTPLVINGEASSTKKIAVTEDATSAPAANILRGYLSPTYYAGADATETLMGMSGGEFKKVQAGTIPANRAVLVMATDDFNNIPDGSKLTFIIEDNCETDGINNHSINFVKYDGNAYNLSGQRVGNDYKGIVIVNGKKLLRK